MTLAETAPLITRRVIPREFPRNGSTDVVGASGSPCAEGASDVHGWNAALRAGDLEVRYQPVVALASGRAVAVEAVADWPSATRSPIGFGDLPPAASAAKAIELGRWSLLRACQEAAAFTGALKELPVAVTIPMVLLIQPDGVAQVREALVKSGLDPRRLVLQVNEHGFVDQGDAAAVALDGLRVLGVQIAIAHFGAGSTSLLFLRRYPISAVNIDRAFVSGLCRNDYDKAICASVVSLARASHASSVAQGVATHEQYSALLDLGCDFGQGDLWSSAVPANELASALERSSQVPVPGPADRWDPAGLALQVRHLQRCGASMHTITAALNKSGAASPTGNLWSVVALRAFVTRLDAEDRACALRTRS